MSALKHVVCALSSPPELAIGFFGDCVGFNLEVRSNVVCHWGCFYLLKAEFLQVRQPAAARNPLMPTRSTGVIEEKIIQCDRSTRLRSTIPFSIPQSTENEKSVSLMLLLASKPRFGRERFVITT